MWKDLNQNDRDEYKKMILAFASLTEMFAQKADSKSTRNPIINSKYQETVFQRVFNATVEDRGNTSIDASLAKSDANGHITKYLIGIKTFNKSSDAQKIMQFKANHNSWTDILNTIEENSKTKNGNERQKDKINKLNKSLYMQLAREISILHNNRMDSAISNLRGFLISEETDDVESVYHVLMPSTKRKKSYIYVGETSYDKIDIDNIEIEGCTSAKKPLNFIFTDGNHKYKFTAADCQLFMYFDIDKIIQDIWEVKYTDDAYAIFSNIADTLFANKDKQIESYSWLITNSKGEVNQFSGFNSFFGIGSKLAKTERKKRIKRMREKYSDAVNTESLEFILNSLHEYWSTPALKYAEKQEKVKARSNLIEHLDSIANEDFKDEIKKVLFRPKDEIYIPIPNSAKFHTEHPDFFSTGAGHLKKEGNKNIKLSSSKEQRKFTLVFEPSGTKIESFITQDAGKAIESYAKQSRLGEWILREIFKLDEYEPLTKKRLDELEINGIRLVKDPDSGEIHLHFIWIDKKNLPDDFIKKSRIQNSEQIIYKI